MRVSRSTVYARPTGAISVPGSIALEGVGDGSAAWRPRSDRNAPGLEPRDPHVRASPARTARNRSAPHRLARAASAWSSAPETSCMTSARAARVPGAAACRSGRSRARPRGRRGGRRGPTGRRSWSRSRTAATEPPAMRSTRRNASRVAGPPMPSTVRPALRWNSRKRRRGLGPEDAVFAPGVESQAVEGVLEGRDVVAAQVRRLEVEQPVAEGEATLDQRGPGLGSDDAVDADLARRSGRRGRRARWCRRRCRTRPGATVWPEPTRRCCRSRTASPRVTRAQDRRDAHARDGCGRVSR